MHAKPDGPEGGGDLSRARMNAARADTRALDCLYLDSVGRWIPTREVELRHDVMEIVIEDLCWRIAMAAWTERRPHRWRHGARIAWQAEGDQLQNRRRGLVTTAGQAGI